MILGTIVRQYRGLSRGIANFVSFLNEADFAVYFGHLFVDVFYGKHEKLPWNASCFNSKFYKSTINSSATKFRWYM